MNSDHKRNQRKNQVTRTEVWEAWLKVKANRGSKGVDGINLQEYEKDLKNNLYKVWNRINAGSYIPPLVLEVKIPKKDGGERRLGIPTISDRVAQTVIKMRLEPRLESIFHPDSYGYRPFKSAHDALKVTRTRCWRKDWVVDMDIKGFFDNISHKLLMKAVDKHVEEKWMKRLIERWLKVSTLEAETQTQRKREKGTPQGGVISPLLANLFLHYVFDTWMKKHYPTVKFARFADDAVCHCESQTQAEKVLEALTQRFTQCELELHPLKTKIVYCKDDDRRGNYKQRSFTFLGYDFRARRSKNWKGKCFINFSPAMSREACQRTRQEIRSWKLVNRSDKTLTDLARMFNAKIQGWINYYGRYYKSELTYKVLNQINRKLIIWVTRKYKKFKGHKRRARAWLKQIYQRDPMLWAHWKIGVTP